MRMLDRATARLGVALATALLAAPLLAAPAAAQRAPQQTDWNKSPAPDAIYGGCLPGFSAFRSKGGLYAEAGQPGRPLQAIVVLDCRPFNGGGGTNVSACPAGSPYALCLSNRNDGAGNAITLGVLVRNAVTQPETAACAGGPSKLALIARAGEDPRLINGAVTLQCGTGTGAMAVRRAPCPPGPSPYGYCLSTGDDGSGHSATIGVVLANGPADPLGYYGECDPGRTRPGFLPKNELIPAGAERNNAMVIQILGCTSQQGVGGTAPATMERRDCRDPRSPVPPLVARLFDYCLFGTDPNANVVQVGVVARAAQ